jgi:hypothetical protein
LNSYVMETSQASHINCGDEAIWGYEARSYCCM